MEGTKRWRRLSSISLPKASIASAVCAQENRRITQFLSEAAPVTLYLSATLLQKKEGRIRFEV